MPEIVMDKQGFHSHMKDKAGTWDIEHAYLGDDFAVFHFKWEYRRREAETNMKQFIDYYGYRMTAKDYMLVIINLAG